MKKMILLSLVLLFLFPMTTVFGQQSDSYALPIPEKNGDYPDPENPGIRVRVFVHEPKQKTATAIQTVCSDPSSDAVVHPAGWHLSSPVRYQLNTASVPTSVGGSNLSTIALNGFNRWEDALSASPNKPTIIAGGTTYTARSTYDKQNIIAWGRTSGAALAVTYIRYNSLGLVVDVDTIMNMKFPWSWSGNTQGSCGDNNSYDAEDILTHEQGHWIGLNDEYTTAYINNTMYGYGAKAEIKKDTLTNGDTIGAQSIYR